MRKFIFALVAVLSLPAISFADDKKDIVDTAVGAGDFKTLVTAVKAADLVETLKGEGPFTVFAPVDAAFKKLPDGTVATLLKTENKDKLAGVLTYHVVAGNFKAKDAIGVAKTSMNLKSVQGSLIKVTLKDGAVYVNDAKVVKTDIHCKNGVIHVIDSVILPPEK